MPDSTDVSVPRGLLDSLTAAAVTGLAQRLLSSVRRAQAAGHADPVIHPGDDFGRVVAHFWVLDREKTMLFLADYMAEVRIAQPDALPLTLTQVLHGLVQYAWPEWAGAEEAERLRDLALARVPAYYGDDSTLL